MHIIVYSDVICPRCFIGKRRLERAVQEAGLSGRVAFDWRPFQLNPGMMTSGMPRSEYGARKLGAERAAALDAEMQQLGEAEGIRFNFKRMRHVPNTVRAHKLVLHAAEEGLGNAVVEALFRAYLEEGRDIGSDPVLLDIADKVGLDPWRARAALGSVPLSFKVAESQAAAEHFEITEVPFFIIKGTCRIVTGAQATAAWLELFQHMANESPAAETPI